MKGVKETYVHVHDLEIWLIIFQDGIHNYSYFAVNRKIVFLTPCKKIVCKQFNVEYKNSEDLDINNIQSISNINSF